MPALTGQLLSVLSAILFGVSPVFCKLVIGDMSPALLAGLLYLGSGLGLQLVLLFQRKSSFYELRRLPLKHSLKLVGAIVSGGVIAPVCLTYGIKYGSASEVSLLLNLETVATTVIAWLVFKEYIGPYVWSGKILILIGAVIVVLRTEGGVAFSLSGLLVVLACVFWGIDNNLTHDVQELSSTVLASIKGLAGRDLLYCAGVTTVVRIGYQISDRWSLGHRCIQLRAEPRFLRGGTEKDRCGPDCHVFCHWALCRDIALRRAAWGTSTCSLLVCDSLDDCGDHSSILGNPRVSPYPCEGHPYPSAHP